MRCVCVIQRECRRKGGVGGGEPPQPHPSDEYKTAHHPHLRSTFTTLTNSFDLSLQISPYSCWWLVKNHSLVRVVLCFVLMRCQIFFLFILWKHSWDNSHLIHVWLTTQKLPRIWFSIDSLKNTLICSKFSTCFNCQISTDALTPASACCAASFGWRMRASFYGGAWAPYDYYNLYGP